MRIGGETQLQQNIALTGGGLAGDPEACAALLLHADATAARKLARSSREQAQAEQLRKLQEGASKLRLMAWQTLGSGILQGVCAFAGAAGKDSTSGRVGAILGASDPFKGLTAMEQASKQLLDAEAQVASHRSQDAGELENEARRIQQAALEGLQKVMEAKHRLAMAAQRL